MDTNYIKKVVIFFVLSFSFLVGAVNAVEETSSTQQSTHKSEKKQNETTLLDDILILLGLKDLKDGDSSVNGGVCQGRTCGGDVNH